MPDIPSDRIGASDSGTRPNDDWTGSDGTLGGGVEWTPLAPGAGLSVEEGPLPDGAVPYEPIFVGPGYDPDPDPDPPHWSFNGWVYDPKCDCRACMSSPQRQRDEGKADD